MTVLERIKFLAKKRDVTIKELSEIIGLSENSIYKWKTAKPKADDLAKIADYFHVSVDYLLGREEMQQPQFSPELNDAIENAEAFEGTPLTDQDKAVLRGVISAYLENRDKNKG